MEAWFQTLPWLHTVRKQVSSSKIRDAAACAWSWATQTAVRDVQGFPYAIHHYSAWFIATNILYPRALSVQASSSVCMATSGLSPILSVEFSWAMGFGRGLKLGSWTRHDVGAACYTKKTHDCPWDWTKLAVHQLWTASRGWRESRTNLGRRMSGHGVSFTLPCRKWTLVEDKQSDSSMPP